jgi:tight adherence protein B
MDIVIGIGIFLSVVLLIEGGYFVFRSIGRPEVKGVRRRLRSLSPEGYGEESIDILRKRELSQVPWLNRLLQRFRWTGRMDRLLEQADTQRPLGFFILLSFVLAAAGFLVFSWMTSNRLISIPAAVILGLVPFFHIYSKKRRRMEKFQRQLPEALELIARSLKAGHAFTGGLKVVIDEFDDPISTEFDTTLNEINFGAGVNEALKNLSDRVDCPDLRFFVISVIIQRETGGNLAEILESIAYLIRERFKLQGHIRTLSAEGKLSAIILGALPFVVAFLLYLINRDYIRTLFVDPIGRIMALFAVIMMVMGILVMRKMIRIQV